jgi:hypothetical protein
MGIAITFCDETEHKRRQNKHYNSLLGRSEAKSMPHLIEFVMPALVQLANALGVNSQFVSFARGRTATER